MTCHFKQLVVVSLLALSAAQAQAVGRLADVVVVDRTNGTTLPVYFHAGQYWIAGQPGAKYAISVCNKLGERLLAVTSVDGINVLSGAAAAWGQTGYVFGNHACYEITGWRKSDRDVAAFEFSASGDSYAALTGRPRELGVIGVALFRERRPEPVIAPPVFQSRADTDSLKESRAGSSPSAPAAAAPATQNESARKSAERSLSADSALSAPAAMPVPIPKLGTAHGQREESVVSHTEFQRAQVRPNELIQIRYESHDALVALGVIQRPMRRLPNAFPMSGRDSYVPDPPAR